MKYVWIITSNNVDAVCESRKIAVRILTEMGYTHVNTNPDHTEDWEHEDERAPKYFRTLARYEIETQGLDIS